MKDLTGTRLIDRKDRLVDLLRDGAGEPRLRYVSHVVGGGPNFFNAVDQLGLDGIVSKRIESVYHPGVPSKHWLKMKCFHTQQFSVIGYTTEFVGEGKVLSSLALAGDREHYAGRVEFGVPRRDDTLLRTLLSTRLSAAPIEGASRNPAIRWVEPRLTAEVRCLRWQPGRHIRHAVLRSISVSAL